jgi:hypothetical protein
MSLKKSILYSVVGGLIAAAVIYQVKKHTSGVVDD